MHPEVPILQGMPRVSSPHWSVHCQPWQLLMTRTSCPSKNQVLTACIIVVPAVSRL